MTQAPTLYPDVAESQATELDFFIYWRRPGNKWIVSAPGHAQEYAKRMRRGWEPLLQYGTFMPGMKSTDTRGHRFNAHREPWRVIFQKGGTAEFPLDQVIAYNWHLAAPYAEVTFPQLEGVEVEVLDCPECEVQPFHEAQHLAQHLRIRHDYTRLELTQYGKEMEIDFTRGRKRPRARQLNREDMETAELTQQLVERGEACGVNGCTWAPSKQSKRPQMALAGHRRMKHQSGSEPAQKGATDGIPKI